MTRLDAGDAAPSFELLDQHGKRVRLQDFRGRKLLVYFYPEADTPGCTTQSCSVRDHRQDLAGIGMDVVGISPDQPDKQLAFDEKYGLGFPLLSDPDHAIANAWGTWGEKSRDGRTYQDEDRLGRLAGEQLSKDPGAVQPRHDQIEDHEVVGLRDGHPEALLPDGGHIDREPLGLQPAAHEVEDPWLVVDEKDAADRYVFERIPDDRSTHRPLRPYPSEDRCLPRVDATGPAAGD